MRRPLSDRSLVYIYNFYMTMFFYHGPTFTLDYILVILRSTTGPYGRPMIEVAYGEFYFSLYRGCMGGDSSGRVVEVSTCCRPCWTYPGQHQCGLNLYYFFDFHTIKFTCIMVFKIYIYKKKT